MVDSNVQLRLDVISETKCDQLKYLYLWQILGLQVFLFFFEYKESRNKNTFNNYENAMTDLLV